MTWYSYGVFSYQSYKVKRTTPWTLRSTSPVSKKIEFESYLDTLLVLLSAPPAALGVSFCPGLWQHVQKAVSRFVAISYCFNPPDRCAVDKPGVKAACRPDWRASLAPAELGSLDRRSVLHEFTAVLADKRRFCSVAFLILKGLPNFLLFRERMQHTQGIFSRRQCVVFQVWETSKLKMCLLFMCPEVTGKGSLCQQDPL